MPPEKDTSIENTADARAKISDVQVVGNPDIWQLACKASSKEQGWMKSTKFMSVPGGVVIQVSTQQGEHVAEALCFVPGVYVDQHEGQAVLRQMALTPAC